MRTLSLVLLLTSVFGSDYAGAHDAAGGLTAAKLKQVGTDQHPGGDLPLDNKFQDETGTEIVRAKIRDLAKMERLLAGIIKQCTGKIVPQCPILDVFDVGRTKSAASLELRALRQG